MRTLSLVRRFPSLLAATALAGALAWPAAQAAGQVEVRFVAPDKFTDIGFGSFERDRSLSALNEIFDGLAHFLPDGQTLRIDVLDVDLAGEPAMPAFRDYRVLRGGVDWPQVTLRYTLQSGGSTVKSGQDRVRDMNYMFSRRGLTASGSSLPYEKRMLENWFRDHFLPAQ